jgi:polysaccharide biosynthesis/export protein
MHLLFKRHLSSDAFMKTPRIVLILLSFFAIHCYALDDFSISMNPIKVANAAPEKTFTIIAGDVLQIAVWKEEGLDRECIVLADGTITFPLIGTLQAQGLSANELQSVIKKKLETLIPDASVTVMIKAPLGHSVSIIGQVVKSGEIIIGRHLSVMEALSQAGGVTPYAATRRIVVLRQVEGKKTAIPFPYDEIIQGNHLDQDIFLNPGDIIVVPTAGLFNP